jgi:hypothetical protein
VNTFFRGFAGTSLAVAGIFAFSLSLYGQYPEWRHRAVLPVLTTTDGAALPESAREENFPLLVRLNGDTFPFQETLPDGADLRFSFEGNPVPYQVEQWDPVAGEAAIWVRVPVIRGNSRHLLMLHWGRDGVASESNGGAVFHEDNGFSVVMHLGETGGELLDTVGTVRGADKGTQAISGVIGGARNFQSGNGIACGEQITGLPAAGLPHTSEAWVRPRQVNSVVFGWGNEQAQGKVVMGLRSPPHVAMDCYFSNANLKGTQAVPLAEWAHVAHTYGPEGARLYVNGRLDSVSLLKGPPLNLRTPARMWVGGWYNTYRFEGAIDEVRVSRVARSADWVRLCYENQKPNQTLVGSPIRPGTRFEVSVPEVVLEEDRTTVVRASAEGADKVYWMLRRPGREDVVVADRLSFTLSAGRVAADEMWNLRFKAVYSDRVQTREIPVRIQNTIPEPRLSLTAPRLWNGRDALEIVPHIENQRELRDAGVDAVRFQWNVSGGAVLREEKPGSLLLRRSQYSGGIRVRCLAENGGAVSEASVEVEVREPASDPWVERVPDPEEKPLEGQFYARDDRNEGTLFYNGVLDRPADAVFLRVYADDQLVRRESKPPGTGGKYGFSVRLKPGLVKYRAEFGVVKGDSEEVLDRVGDLVCGDAFLIDGQSNALATDTREDAPRETSEWIRSYGGPTGRGDATGWVRDRVQEAVRGGLRQPNLWCRPVWKKEAPAQMAELGWWGMELAKSLVAQHRIPVCLIQAAVGGSRIDEHLPSAADPADLTTLYGRMLWRLQQARLTHGIRAVLWHQGENDQGADGPTGGYGWESYHRFFVDMAAAWRRDMPNIGGYYVFQIAPNACAMGGQQGSGDRLREAQRTLPRLFSHMHLLSTLGVKPPGGCHYPLEGWAQFSQMLLPLLGRDFHGVVPNGFVTPPALQKAYFSDAACEELVVEFDQPVVWRDEMARDLYLDDQPGEVVSGRVERNELRLRLRGKSAARRVTYLKERDWSPNRLIEGANGLAALTFCDVPIAEGR